MQYLLHRLWSFEALAVVLAIAYLLLAARESLWCWYCALGSSLIYIVIFFDVSLLMESLLNVFYAVMAVVGWWEWRRGGAAHQGLKIVTLRWQLHVLLLAAMLLLFVFVLLTLARISRQRARYHDTSRRHQLLRRYQLNGLHKWLAILFCSGKLLLDRKSTRLNSSHITISDATLCLKKKK
mgnify:CR=1 FL=1